MIEAVFVDIKNYFVFDVWNFVVNEKSRFGDVDLFWKAEAKFVHRGRECYEQGLVPWDKECWWHQPATSNEHSHIHHIGTVINIMGARVKFKRTVSVRLC